MSGVVNGVPRVRPRTLLVLAALAMVLWLAFIAREALAPFGVGLVLAYLLTPPVRRLEAMLPFRARRPDLARLVAVITVYAMAVALLALLLAFGIPPLVQQVTRFFAELPGLLDESRTVVQEWLRELQTHVPPEVQAEVDEAVRQIGMEVVRAAQDSVLHSFSIVFETFSVLLGILTVPVWLFFVLKDRERFSAFFYTLFPERVRPDAAAVAGIVNRILSAYVRAQLLLGAVIGVATAVGLSIMGVPFALVLGLIAGVTEMIPVVGPILGSLAGIVVTLATRPDLWLLVVGFYLVIQQIENNVLVPRVQGQALDIHPALIMVLLVAASELGGFVAMLVAAPLAAVARDVFLYLYHRLGPEEPAHGAAGEHAQGAPAVGAPEPPDVRG